MSYEIDLTVKVETEATPQEAAQVVRLLLETHEIDVLQVGVPVTVGVTPQTPSWCVPTARMS